MFLSSVEPWKVTREAAASTIFPSRTGWDRMEWIEEREGKEGRKEGVNKMGGREGEKKGGIEINGMKTSIPLQLATSLRVVAACNGIKTD